MIPAQNIVAWSQSVAVFRRVFARLVDRLPGEPWAKIEVMKLRFDVSW